MALVAQWLVIGGIVALVPLAYWRPHLAPLRWASYVGAFFIGVLVGIALFAAKIAGQAWVAAFGIFAVIGHRLILSAIRDPRTHQLPPD